MKKIYLSLPLLVIAAGYSQTPSEREWIISHYNANAVKTLQQEIEAKTKANQELTKRLAATYNWPETLIDENGNFKQLVGVQENGTPNYYSANNHNSAISTRTDYLNTGGSLNLGLDGDNMHVGIWDEQLLFADHIEFQGRVIDHNGNNFGLISPHAAHVTGTILAAGLNANAKGMAPKATGAYYNWTNDLSEAAVESGQGLLVSNHSYGIDPDYYAQSYIGNYSSQSESWDQLMNTVPYYLMVVAAGNNGIYINTAPMPGAGTGENYDKLYGFTTAKNNLVVANAKEIILDANGNLISASINPFSSQGPTDDLRIKPDITGKGTFVYSTIPQNKYGSNTGTSMASPNISGTLLLLQQYSRNLNNGFMRAATLKGLALHTADDILVEGPDAISGWGVLNAKKAAETMRDNNNKSLILENSLSNSESHSFEILSDGIHPLSVSISWTDLPGVPNNLPPANNPTPKLVNNLNLRVAKDTNSFFPYLLTSPTTSTTGINNVDPFERVDIENASGLYAINIDHAGVLGYNMPQQYTLIITGAIVCAPAIEVSQNVANGEHDIRQSYQNITAHNTIASGAEAHYRATDYVVLTNGFVASSGSNLLAEISPCNPILPQSVGNRTAIPTQEKESEIKELMNKKLTIYPNPASQSITIEVNSGTINTISITSIDGKSIQSKKTNSTSEKLDVSFLDSGIYLITVETNLGEIITEKLIIE